MNVTELENLRIKAHKSIMFNFLYLFGFLIGFGCFGLLVRFGTPNSSNYFFGYFVIGAIGLFWRLVSSDKSYNEFRSNFKSSVIASVISKTLPKSSYQPKEMIGKEVFAQSGLFSQSYNNYLGEDRISTTEFGNLKLSELDVYYETTTTDSQGNSSTSRTTIFKGIFGVATFPFLFEGRTFVIPRSNFWDSTKGEEVKLESPRFMEIWKVKSDSQLGARLALGTDIMNNMLYLKDSLPKDNIHLSFIDQSMYFAISKSKFLEPDWKKPLIEQDVIKEFELEIQTITNVISSFKLHQNKSSKVQILDNNVQ
jgi:Protein of unknown function (DUF3137)